MTTNARHSIDLHTHSRFSDGLLSPAELVSLAHELNLSTLALTDHDTLDGLPEVLTTGTALGIDVIPGVELSAESGEHEIHILGYFVDPADSTLRAALAINARDRDERIEQMVERLGAQGIAIELDRVRAIAGNGTIGRPHIARALIEAGYVDSVSEAFNQYLSSGKPAYVPRRQQPAETSVVLIREANAVPVLAHPLSTGDIEGTLKRLVPAGLLGIEVYYGEYPVETHEQLLIIAQRWNLIATGGSDFHGAGFKEGRDLGSAPVPPGTAGLLRHTWELNRGNWSYKA